VTKGKQKFHKISEFAEKDKFYFLSNGNLAILYPGLSHPRKGWGFKNLTKYLAQIKYLMQSSSL